MTIGTSISETKGLVAPPLKYSSNANSERSASRCARNSIWVAGISCRSRQAVATTNSPISASTEPIGRSGTGMWLPQCSQAMPAAQPASSDTRTASSRPSRACAGSVDDSVKSVADGMAAL